MNILQSFWFFNNRQKFGPTESDLGCHLCAGLTLPLAGWLKESVIGLQNAKDAFQLICQCFIKRGGYDLKQQGFTYSFQILLIFLFWIWEGPVEIDVIDVSKRYLSQAENWETLRWQRMREDFPLICQISWLLHLGSFQQLAHTSQLLGTYCEISWNDLCQVSNHSNPLWICSSQLDVIQVVSLLAVRQKPQLYLIWWNCDLTSSGFVPNDGFPLENTPWLVSKCSTSVNDLHFIKQKPEKSLKRHSCLYKIQVAGIATTSRHIPNHSIVKQPDVVLIGFLGPELTQIESGSIGCRQGEAKIEPKSATSATSATVCRPWETFFRILVSCSRFRSFLCVNVNNQDV